MSMQMKGFVRHRNPIHARHGINSGPRRRKIRKQQDKIPRQYLRFRAMLWKPLKRRQLLYKEMSTRWAEAFRKYTIEEIV